MPISMLAFSMFLLAAESAGSAASESKATEPLFPVKVVADVVYGKGRVVSSDDTPTTSVKDLVLDAYVPVGADAPDKPAVVLVHGGGFRGGDKTKPRFPDLANYFAERGMVCFSINYRMMGDNPPTPGVDLRLRAIYAGCRDTKAAVRWVRANARTYGIDPNRIGILGGSAGAFCAVIDAITDDDQFASDGPDDPTIPDNHPGESARVQACVDLWGSAGPFLDRIDSGDPPMVIIHGTEDPLVPFADAEKIRDQYAKAGVPCAFHPMEGAGHAPWNTHFDSIRDWSYEFLREHLTPSTR